MSHEALAPRLAVRPKSPTDRRLSHLSDPKLCPAASSQVRCCSAVETGRVYWIAKPRVGMTEITGLGDVQRFYMVLSPGGDRAESPNRLVIIGEPGT